MYCYDKEGYEICKKNAKDMAIWAKMVGTEEFIFTKTKAKFGWYDTLCNVFVEGSIECGREKLVYHEEINAFCIEF